MDLRQFRIFASVARHSSVTRAAQELHLSQPALSPHLKALQEQFGSLLKKNGRGLELTKHGEVFFSEITVILAQIDALDRKYGVKADSENSKLLCVGGSHGPATVVLPSLLARFKQHHPSIDLDFKVRNSPAMQDLVIASKVELAVITYPEPSALLQMEPFRTFQLCFFVAAHHPLAKTKQISAETLARFPLVTGRTKKARSRTEEVLSGMMAKGLKLNVLLRCEWPDAIKTVVQQGDAVGIHYLDLVEQGVRDGLFKIIHVRGANLSAISYIVYSREKSLSRSAEAFLAFLRAARENGSLGRTLLRNLKSFLIVFLPASFAFRDLTFAL